MPTINAPATELNTVFEILYRSELIRKELLLDIIVVVMDQAIFAKATEIAWRHQEQFSNVVLRMGTFHTICNALSIIRKRFGDAGLKDICIEAGIVAEGSITGVLDGKHYNCAVRTHKYVYEALMRLVWAEFLEWKESDQEASSIIMEFVGKLKDLACDENQQNFNKLLNSPLLSKLAIMWNSFLEHSLVTVLLMALQEGRQSKGIDVVFDTYQENSIKNSERSVRGEETGHQLQSITALQIVRQWRTFLSRIKNKSNLIAFIVNEWGKEQCRAKLHEKILYATAGEKCYKITSHGSTEVSALQCFQEEADGRLLLHASHAADEGYHTIVICSEDTDVFVMSLAFHDKIGASLLQKCGTKARRRVVDISKVAATIGMRVQGSHWHARIHWM